MQASDLQDPEVLAKIIASQTSLVNNIPSDATGTAAASQAEGFPEITMTPIPNGGEPPDGKDFNGFLKLLSSHTIFSQNGGSYTFNPDVSSAIGGYPNNAILWYITDDEVRVLKSTKDNNIDNFIADPSVIGTSWVDAFQSESTFGNVGDIQWTSKKVVPTGGSWCDGSQYTQSQFPDFYAQLTAGNFNTISYADYQTQLDNNSGECGYYGIDTSAQTFKVPTLNSVFIRSTNDSNSIGTYQQDAIRNITGSTSVGSITGVIANGGVASGAFYSNTSRTSSLNGTTGTSYDLGLDASLVVPTADENRPKNICYRPYVVLYQSAVEASEAQAAEFIQGLANKANIDLENVAANIDYVVDFQYNEDGSWYRKYKSGWIEQGGRITSTSTAAYVLTFLIPFSNTYYHITKNLGSSASGAPNDRTISFFNKETTNATTYQSSAYVDTTWEAKGI